MYESLLPKRSRSAYRCSRWRKRLDDRARTLFAWGYLRKTVGYHLREWVDFLREYEGHAELPTDIQDPEVVAYLGRRCADLWEGNRHVRASLGLLLHPKVERSRRHPCARKTTTALHEAYVPEYLTFAREHRGCRRPDIIEGRLQGFFGWLDAQGVNDIEAVSSALIRDYFASLTHLAPSTVTGQVSALRGFLRYLGMKGTIPTVLALIVESPRRGQQGIDFGTREEGDQGAREALAGNSQYLLDLCRVGWLFQRRIAEEGVDCGEAQIAAANADTATFLQVVQKRHDQRGVDLLEAQA